MARTKASVGAKVSSGKSSKARCSAAPPPSSGGSSGSGDRSSRRHSGGGGNQVCQRETPKWQRPITNFFMGKDVSQPSSDADDNGDEISAGASKSKPKRNVIESDDEDDVTIDERPKNRVLDETIELEPLSGEDSHKIEEYYPKNEDVTEIETKNGGDVKENGVKGKGVGKKTNKENIDTNVERRKSVKRDLDEIASEENISENVSKKVKVN